LETKAPCVRVLVKSQAVRYSMPETHHWSLHRVSELTYTVSSGTVNSTVIYDNIPDATFEVKGICLCHERRTDILWRRSEYRLLLIHKSDQHLQLIMSDVLDSVYLFRIDEALRMAIQFAPNDCKLRISSYLFRQ